MNGPTPEAEPNPMARPMSSNTATMGNIHHILRRQRKAIIDSLVKTPRPPGAMGG